MECIEEDTTWVVGIVNWEEEATVASVTEVTTVMEGIMIQQGIKWEGEASSGTAITNDVWKAIRIPTVAWRTGRGNPKFPQYLCKKYCGHFADLDMSCTFKDKCNFAHVLFPNEYAEYDVPIMMEYIKNTQGLEWQFSVKKSR